MSETPLRLAQVGLLRWDEQSAMEAMEMLPTHGVILTGDPKAVMECARFGPGPVRVVAAGVTCPWCQSTDVDFLAWDKTARCIPHGHTFDKDGWSDGVPEGYRDDLWVLLRDKVQHWAVDDIGYIWLTGKKAADGSPEWVTGQAINTSTAKVKPNPRPAVPKT